MSEDLLGYGQWRQLDPLGITSDRGTLLPLLPLVGFGATIARLIVVHDVPSNGVRGGHAHQRARQAVLATAGAFDVTVSSTRERRDGLQVTLSTETGPLVAGPGVWLWLESFSADAVAMTVFDIAHDPDELISD